MELTFFGHQTWLISCGGTNVLLDPVLAPRFGHGPVDFRVFPPRHVDVARMPRIDAAILSHEHLDHFHLPSIALLPREVPFFVGHLMPGCVTRAIEALGFKVRRIPPGVDIRVGALDLRLYAGSRETAFWERRVTQVHARPAGSSDPGVFIAVDALLSEDFAREVAEGRTPAPHALVVSNNSQYPPPGAIGAYSNLLPLPENSRVPGQFPGLAILHSLMLRYLDELGEVPCTILCGNGFVSMGEAFGPFLFSDNKKLAAAANALAVEERAFGPHPGEKLTLTPRGAEVSRVDWIALDEALLADLMARQAAFLRAPAPPPFRPIMAEFERPEEVRAAVRRVEAELETMARALMLSKVGTLALSVDRYLDGPLGPRRILFGFLEGRDKPSHQFALDLVEGRFVRDDTPEDELLTRYPFGIEMHLQDFCAVLDGRLQIWDLAGNSMRSWFLGSVYENVVVFLFENYGEQVRQDLATKVYSAAIERLSAGREAS